MQVLKQPETAHVHKDKDKRHISNTMAVDNLET